MKKLLSSFKAKVLFSYVIIIFFPMMVLSSLMYYRISNGYKEQIQYAADQAFEQTVKYIESKVNTIIKASDIVYLNQDVQKILRRKRSDVEDNNSLQYEDSLLLDDQLYWLKNNEDIYSVKLYVHEWLNYSGQEDYYGKLEYFWETSYYDRLEDYRGKVLWLPPRQINKEDNYYETVSAVSMVRKINDSNNLNKHNGIIEVYILQELLYDIIKRAGITQEGLVFIENEQNEIITSTSKERISTFKNEDYRYKRDVGWEYYEVNEEKYNVRVAKIDNTDWELIAIMPIKALTKQANQVRNLMLYLLLLIGIVTFGISFFFSNSFTNRIHCLTENMISVQKGDLDVHVNDEHHDEVGQLNRSFNFMVQRLRVLLEEQYKNGQKLKSAELKALQAQINPHFLYNTLDLINWKALEKDAPEIGEISKALAKFYKLNLNKGKDIVTIKDELEHIVQYIKIQNMRFENRVKFIDKIPKELYNYQIPKTIFQPLVENSIMHGILKRKNQSGSIIINGKIDNNGDIIIQIKDNGVGMEESILSEILYSYRTKENHGYGVKNIHERLQLNYGEKYGLSYKSTLQKGTEVTIKIPALKDSSSDKEFEF